MDSKLLDVIEYITEKHRELALTCPEDCWCWDIMQIIDKNRVNHDTK